MPSGHRSANTSCGPTIQGSSAVVKQAALSRFQSPRLWPSRPFLRLLSPPHCFALTPGPWPILAPDSLLEPIHHAAMYFLSIAEGSSQALPSAAHSHC